MLHTNELTDGCVKCHFGHWSVYMCISVYIVFISTDSIVLDLCGYEKAEYSDALLTKLALGSTEDASTVRRFVLPIIERKMVITIYSLLCVVCELYTFLVNFIII